MQLELIWHNRTIDLPTSLWDACFSPPQEGLFWFRSLESGELSDQFKFLFGLLRQDGVAIGIVPAFLFDVPLRLVLSPWIAKFVTTLARGPLSSLATQRTLFVGNVAGEEGHVGLIPSHTLQEIALFVHSAMRAKAHDLKAPMLVWKDFPGRDCAGLDTLLLAAPAFRMVSYPGTVIPVIPGGYAAFLATVPSARRWKINDKLRRGAKKVSVRTEIVAQPTKSELDEMFPLFWQMYLRGKTKFERLTPEFFRAIAASKESTFIIQRDANSQKMLAFMLMLDLGQRVINRFIGIDHAAAAGGFLHFRLFAAAYDWACTTKATEIQSGQTGYMAKLDMGHGLVPLWNYCEHRNLIVNWIYHHAASRITWEGLDGQLGEYLKAHPEARAGAWAHTSRADLAALEAPHNLCATGQVRRGALSCPISE